MELDLQSVAQFFDPVVTFFRANAPLLIFFLIVLFTVFLGFLLQRVGGDLFRLYRRNFFSQVDKGLRDVVIMMEPGQLFTITVIAASVIGPLVLVATNIVIALVVVSVILFAPPVILRYMKIKRSDKFVEQMPDALLAMSSSLRSGLNLVKSFQQIVKNQPQPLAQEFAQILVEYRVGNDLNDSLDDLARRIGRADVVLMNSAIKISRAVGGNLADTLEILARTLREKSKVEGKIRALTSMGKAQGRLATGFPVFMGFVFYKLEPEAMGLLFTSTLGHIWIGVMTGMAVLGSVFIKKVVTVDV